MHSNMYVVILRRCTRVYKYTFLKKFSEGSQIAVSQQKPHSISAYTVKMDPLGVFEGYANILLFANKHHF